jgi:hypothetical protein
MAITSIPKARLVSFIIEDISAADKVKIYFNIRVTNIEERLLSFRKEQLLSFIATLGQDVEDRLHNLETMFPLRRPPTFYLSFIESCPSQNKIILSSRSLAQYGRGGGIEFDQNETVRFVYLPQLSVSMISVSDIKIIQYQLHYEHKFEYVQTNEEAPDYGQIVEAYSLETAMIWLPLEKYRHAIIACYDYSALSRIRNYFAIKLNIIMYPPYLDKKMVERITFGAIPRSATYSLQLGSEGTNEVQHITISDPSLPSKPIFSSMIGNPDREQTSGFYTAHPGLAMGGIGVSKRYGKIWTPRRLDTMELATLSLEIIKHTEFELNKLAKANDFINLTKYYYTLNVRIGDKVLDEKARKVWALLIPLVFQAQEDPEKEETIRPSIVNNLIRQQKPLKLLAAIEYYCPSCDNTLLMKCPICHQPLALKYERGLKPICISPKCNWTYDNNLHCDCGEEIQFTDLIDLIRIIPEDECNKSIKVAARKYHRKYKGTWIVKGQRLKYIETRQEVHYPQLTLREFQLWKTQAKIDHYPRSLDSQKIISILNKTKEKCKRDGTPASYIKCDECKNSSLNPDWILKGDTCLLRLFGIPIGYKFDGVHFGQEKADLRYQDTLIDSLEPATIWIHVKSRVKYRSQSEVSRTNLSIKGLYTQSIFSAYRSVVNHENVQVIGIAIPNKIKTDVIKSLAYAINTLGYSFLVVEEDDWLAIINSALDQAEFEFSKKKGI